MQDHATYDEREWLAQQFESLPDGIEMMTPSAWAEANRYLPASVTSLPGYYRFEVAPYLREILDCLSLESPVREVVVQKGVQVGATVGVLENAIGYYIAHVRTAPMMLVTADAELAKLRVDSYILPMIQHSGLEHLIRSSDEKNARKTGKTEKKIEWMGGGFLIPLGAQNPSKLRSASIQVLLRDEVDGWPLTVGKDGDPMKLSADRTAAFETSRKLLDLSTPLIKGQSQIEKRFKMGDQRRYFVCCLGCGHPQVLRFKRQDEDGVLSGMIWELDHHGNLVPDSVRYRCQRCGHEHVNEDKTRLLSPEHGAEWRPTAQPTRPDIRSYHLSALYAPVGMQTWAACVHSWLEAWDEDADRPKDLAKLQVFYNNVLGDPYELRGQRLRYEQVSPHRRKWYRSGEIPNRTLEEVCGGPVLVVVCTVDVHKDSLAVAVMGWCRDKRVVVISYTRLEGDTEQLDNPTTWGALRELIEQKRFTADDGKTYPIALTFIDSGYNTERVYSFCEEYDAGVYPVKGQAGIPQRATVREFHEFTTPLGARAFGITVDLYKDRWSGALRREWGGTGVQPAPFFNAPEDITDKQLRELTAEVKTEKIDKETGERIGWEWRRPSGAANELWDLLCYSNCALDVFAWDYCMKQLELDAVNWPTFWDHLLHDHPFFELTDGVK